MSETRDFWSRRKAAVEAEAVQAEDDHRADEAPAPAHEDTRSDAEILAELDLPDPDELQPGDDIAGFMAGAVPDRLRRRALRQLWKLNPMLANLDGLLDYGEDFTDAGMAGEVIATTYQVGKGMLAHVEEIARQAEVEAAGGATPAPTAKPVPETAPSLEPNVDPAPEPAPDSNLEPNLESLPDRPADPVAPTMAEAPPPAPTIPDSAPAPRRMRFAFEG